MDQNRLWFRAQVTSKVSEYTYEATIFRQNGILYEGILLLEPGLAWDNSQPLITVNKSNQLHARSKDKKDKFNQTDSYAIPKCSKATEGMKKQALSKDLLLQLAQKFYPEIAKDPSIVVITGNLEADPSSRIENHKDPFGRSKTGMMRTPKQGSNLEQDQTPPRTKWVQT